VSPPESSECRASASQRCMMRDESGSLRDESGMLRDGSGMRRV
jgi:hypothetical protein